MSTGGIQLRLGDFVYAVLKRWKLILAMTFIGLVFGIMLSAVSYMQGSYSSYEIGSSFVILARTDHGTYSSYDTTYQHSGDYHYAEDMVDSVNYIIKSDMTINRAIETLHMIGITPRDIVQNLRLSQYNATPIIEATLTWRDAEEGVSILRAVLDSARVTLQTTMDVGDVAVINDPAARQSLSGSIGGSVWGYMTALGFLAGIGYVVMELLMRPTLTNLKDVETLLGLETLGTIPKDDKYFRKKASFLVEDDIRSPAVTQNYASTAFILRNRLSSAKAPRRFYVTSTIAGEGKSVVAANLAIQLSDMEQKVLLIDMDTKNPKLGKLLLSNVSYDRSLNALYAGDATREDAIYTLTGYLDILPTVIGRQPIPMDGTVFDLIRELSEGYDYVIMDAAPVGQVSDVLNLNQVADTALFVLRYDNATIPEIRASLEKLDKSGIRILGCVVNAAQNITNAARVEGLDERLTRRRKKDADEPKIWEKTEGEEAVSLKAPEPDKGKKKPPKVPKGHFRKKKKDASAADAAPAMPRPAPAMPRPAPLTMPETADASVPAGRNPMAELLGEKPQAAEEPSLSDEDAAQALYKMGVEGVWSVESQSAPPPQIAFEPEADGAPHTEAAEAPVVRRRVRKPRVPLLILFILFAVPLTLAGAALLIALAMLLLAAAVAAVAFSVSGFISAFAAMPTLGEKLSAAGLSLIAAALGALLLWLSTRVLLAAVPALVRAVKALGRRWCYKEVTV